VVHIKILSSWLLAEGTGGVKGLLFLGDTLLYSLSMKEDKEEIFASRTQSMTEKLFLPLVYTGTPGSLVGR
jgi:hypothetical protein